MATTAGFGMVLLEASTYGATATDAINNKVMERGAMVVEVDGYVMNAVVENDI